MSAFATRCSRAPVCALVALAVASGCSDITQVQGPAVITPSDVNNPAGALSLRAGALSSLFGSFAGQSLYSGLLVDEFSASSSQSAASFPEDQRVLTVGNSGNYPFGGLSGGRIDAKIAITALKQFSPQPPSYIGELYALIAASEIEFAEDICSGVPLAIVTGVTPRYGPTLSRQQLVRQALIDLDSAATYSTSSDSIANLVAVLRGRAYSDSGNLVAASTAVQNVPVTFAYTAELSDTNNPNAIYQQIVSNGVITVSDREGINGLPFVSANDPRLPTVALQANGTAVVAPAAASNGSSPLTMASGIEAQLLQAEAALSAGQVGTWSSILNALRQNGISPSMAPLTADSTTGASPSMQLAVMFRERAFWLFGTGHREGDVRRLVRQYGLPVNTVYPTGPYFGGPSQYGSSAVFPVGGEGDDPGYHGCLNTSP
jgi:hypothetical protein